jgi:hypothetical protein
MSEVKKFEIFIKNGVAWLLKRVVEKYKINLF